MFEAYEKILSSLDMKVLALVPNEILCVEWAKFHSVLLAQKGAFFLLTKRKLGSVCLPVVFSKLAEDLTKMKA